MPALDRSLFAIALIAGVLGLYSIGGEGPTEPNRPLGANELAQLGLLNSALMVALTLAGGWMWGQWLASRDGSRAAWRDKDVEGSAGGLAPPPRLSPTLGLGVSPRPLGVRAGAAIVAGMLGLSQLLDAAVRSSQLHAGSRLELIDRIVAESRDENALWLLAGLAIAPAIAEELLFRGLLLRLFIHYWGLIVAVPLSAALFGAAHMDLAQGLAAMVLGLYLASVVIVTGGLRTAIACHLVNNAAAVLGSASLVRSGWGDSIFVLPAASAALLLALLLLFRRRRQSLATAMQRNGPGP